MTLFKAVTAASLAFLQVEATTSHSIPTIELFEWHNSAKSWQYQAGVTGVPGTCSWLNDVTWSVPMIGKMACYNYVSADPSQKDHWEFENGDRGCL